MAEPPDLFFAWCAEGPPSHTLAVGQGPGWYLIYPGDDARPAGDDDELYVGPFAAFAAAVQASLEERP